MRRSIFRQETQIRPSDTYLDNIAAGQATLETASANLETDMNALRSQIKRILDDSAGSWYDDIPTVNTKQRDLRDLNTDLDSLEEKRILCPVVKTTNVTVPANSFASGSIVAIPPTSLLDTETFTLDDGRNTAVVFEFDKVPDGVTPGNILVDISAAVTNIDVANAMVSAINGVGSALLLTADNAGGTSATVTITHDLGGTHGNVTTWDDTVVNAGFVVNQPTGGAGDVVVLNQAGGETPSDVAAVDGGTALGAVVATLAGDVGSHDLADVSSTTPSIPKNRLMVWDASNHKALIDVEERQIYGLLQAETGVADGEAFNDTDKQAQISFVVIDDNDNLVPAAGDAIGGKTVEYSYAKRVSFDSLPEDCTFPGFTFTDSAGSVTVTLNNAIDNQGVTPATQDQSIFVDMTTGGVAWTFRDANSVDLLKILEGSAGGTSEVEIAANVDVFDVDAVDNDFLNGVKVDSGGTLLNLGVTSGQVDSAGALTVASGGSANLTLQASGEMLFLDTNKSGSTYVGDLKLAETQTEWDDFETAMEAIFGSGNGEVSILKAITAASENRRKAKVYAVVQSTVNADTDVGGPSDANNLDVDLPDMTLGDFLLDYDVFLNGQLLWPGADSVADNDYYPGTGARELKFEFKLKTDDVLAVQPYS